MGGTGKPVGDKRPPRGVSIREHKSVKSIQIAFVFRGVRCRESLRLDPTTANLRYAEGLRAEIMRKIVSESFKYQDYFPDSPRAALFGYVVSKKTVGDLLRAHLDGCEHAVKNGNLSPSTIVGYRRIINGHLLPQFDKVEVRALAPSLLRQWLSSLGVTAKTARNIVSVLRSALDDAVNDELIDQNPLEKIALKKLLSMTSKKSEYEVDPFDNLEIDAIIGTATGQARNLFQFAFWSGLRTSELIGLEWDDVDWIHGTVRVQRAVVAKTEKGPKTKAGTRDVLLLPSARAALQAQKEHTFLAGNRVFHNPRTGLAWETDGQIRKTCWTLILKKAGVRYRNPYQTRHSYASRMLSAGENPWWVAKQMGHVDVEMVFRHYGKWIPNADNGQYRPVNDWNGTPPANDTRTTRDGGK